MRLPLQYGDSGKDVKLIQRKLNAKGAKLKVDGDYGRKTEKAVSNFQHKHHLVVDGIFGRETYKKLFPVRAAVTKKPVTSKPRVALDIGHGMHNRKHGVFDPGAKDEHYRVEEFVLALAIELKAHGYPVLVIHDTSLQRRDDIAKAWGADILISNHLNASTAKSTGIEAFIDGGSKLAGSIAADLCHDGSKILGINNRGVKKFNGWAVLRKVKVDLLMEWAFLPHDRETFKKNKHLLVAMTYKTIERYAHKL